VTKASAVFKLDSAGNQLQKYGAAGCGPSLLGSDLQVAAVGPDNFYVTDSLRFGGVIHHFASGTGALIGTCPSQTPTFNQIQSVVFGAKKIYVIDAGAGRLYRYSTRGRLLGRSQRGRASLVAVDRKGNLYYSNGTGAIRKYSPDGKLLGSTAQLSLETATVASDGSLWAMSIEGQVMHLPAIGKGKKVIRKWWIKGWSELQGGLGPIGIVLDGRGNVWIADIRHANLQEFSPKGRLMRIFGHKGSGPRQFRQPEAMASEGKHVFVDDFGNDRIQEFDLKGNLVAIYGRSGAGIGQLSKPNGIAIDGAGNLYVGDRLNDRVQELSRS
jgi:DNA-binding beta-propeller fold protein YncE